MEEDAEDAEGEPGEEVLVIECEGEGEAEDGAGFAEGAGDDEAGLDEGGILLGDGSFEEAFFKGERKEETRHGRDGKAEDHRTALARDALRELKIEKLLFNHEQHHQKQDLRHEQCGPQDDKRLVLGDEVGFFVIHCRGYCNAR